MSDLCFLDHVPVSDVYDPSGAMWKDSIAELEHDIDQYREIDQDNLKRIAVLEAKLDAVVNCKLRTAYDKHGEVTEAFFSVNDVLKAAGFEERRSE